MPSRFLAWINLEKCEVALERVFCPGPLLKGVAEENGGFIITRSLLLSDMPYG